MSERWTVVEARTTEWEQRGSLGTHVSVCVPDGSGGIVVGLCPAFQSGRYRIRVLVERDDSYEPEGDKR